MMAPTTLSERLLNHTCTEALVLEWFLALNMGRYISNRNSVQFGDSMVGLCNRKIRQNLKKLYIFVERLYL